MESLALKYGLNPDQTPARVYAQKGELPFEVLNGRPGYINLLDALNAWQLVRSLKKALSLPAAASFKHVSPAGAALGIELSDVDRRMFRIDPSLPLSPLACAYARARGADRMSSFGDFIALSDECDEATAELIHHEVSDGIIAPGYTDKALDILKQKRKGAYTILKIDADFEPDALETRTVFGVTFEAGRSSRAIDESLLTNIVTQNKTLPESAKRDLILSLIVLRYTQSNSVCYAYGGQTVGVGAGQQSRVHCTRLAGDKADKWFLRRSERALSLPFLPALAKPDRDNATDIYLSDEQDALLDNWQAFFTEKPAAFDLPARRAYLDKIKGVSLGSDAFFPFGDNIDRAFRSGVSYVAQPGGSVRDDQVISRCDAYGMVMAMTGLRLFHH